MFDVTRDEPWGQEGCGYIDKPEHEPSLLCARRHPTSEPEWAVEVTQVISSLN